MHAETARVDAVAAGSRLEGRVALVTGAAQGLGLGIAQTFAREGARVVISDLNAQALQQASAGFRNAGQAVTAVVGNVGVVADCERMVRAAVEAYGRLDILVNNVGGSA